VKLKLNLEIDEPFGYENGMDYRTMPAKNTGSDVALQMPVLSVSSQHLRSLFSITYKNV